MFTILKKDEKTSARLGVLSTPHGQIRTPAYVIVATHAQIKCLKPSDIKKTKTQVVISNTYHLWDQALKIENSKLKIHGILGTKIPMMTDSGGFQVFSLAFDRHDKAGKIFPRGTAETQKKIEKRNIKITDKGVYFLVNGKEKFLNAETSMKIQRKIGADIIFAFDECTSFFDGFKYNKKAMERTHSWAQASLKCKVKSEKLNGKRQLLFGIVQGGRYKSLRVKSAKFIGSLPFDGFGIGGSFGKEEMSKMLKWIIPYLPEEKPRHLLGIGRIEDVFRAVESGVDLFDCVIPTREARHGRIWTAKGHYDIRKTKYADKKSGFESECRCPACKKGITQAKLHKLFKDIQPVRQAQGRRWATIHNVWFFNTLLEKIRKSIAQNRFREFKKSYRR